jgi:transcriptional regulator with XRE-family HTH domain
MMTKRSHADEHQTDHLIAMVGARIREVREAKGWTQQELGARIGTSRATVNALENGRIKRLGPQRIHSVSQVTEYPIAFFYHGITASTEGVSTETIADLVAQDSMPHCVGAVLLKLLDMPSLHQERVCRWIEQCIAWYQRDILSDQE